MPIPVSTWSGPDHPAVTAVREIVESARFASPRHAEPPPDVGSLADPVTQAWQDWHTLPDNRSAVAAGLPRLFADLEAATTIVLDGAERRAAHASLASAYGLVQHLAVDVVEPEATANRGCTCTLPHPPH